MKQSDDMLPHEIRFGRPPSTFRGFLEKTAPLINLLSFLTFLVFLVLLFTGMDLESPPMLLVFGVLMVSMLISNITYRALKKPRMWLVVNDQGMSIGYWVRPQSWNITWPEVAHVSVFHISSKNSLTGKHVLVVKPRRSTPWFSTKTPTDPVSYQFLFHDVALHRHFWDRGYLAVLHLDNVDAHPEVLREAVETFGGPDRYRTEAELCAQDPGLKP